MHFLVYTFVYVQTAYSDMPLTSVHRCDCMCTMHIYVSVASVHVCVQSNRDVGLFQLNIVLFACVHLVGCSGVRVCLCACTRQECEDGWLSPCSTVSV